MEKSSNVEIQPIVIIITIAANLRGSFVIEGCLIVFGTRRLPNTSSSHCPVNGGDDEGGDDDD